MPALSGFSLGFSSGRSTVPFGVVDRGCPASQQVQRLLGAGTGLGRVGEEGQPVVGCDVHAVEAQAELTDDGVVEELDGGRVEADDVGGTSQGLPATYARVYAGLVETKKEIQKFLTSRRAAITPEQAGVPS
jgi:hypothetical protein